MGRGRRPNKTDDSSPEGQAAYFSVVELARSRTVDAIFTLTEVALNGRSESARVRAAEALLDRGWGRSPSTTNLTHSVARDDETLEAVAEKILANRRGDVAALDTSLLDDHAALSPNKVISITGEVDEKPEKGFRPKFHKLVDKSK